MIKEAFVFKLFNNFIWSAGTL